MKNSQIAIRSFVAGLTLVGCTHTTPEQPSGPACTPAPGTICTLAGVDGISGLGGDGGPAWQAWLDYPVDVTYGPDKNVYVVDYNNHRIRKIDAATGKISTFAGTDDLGDGPEGPALQSHFNHPTNIVFDKSGNLLIAAWHNSRIKTVDPTGNLTNTCGDGRRLYMGEGGPAKAASFDLPGGVAFGPDGTLFIMDQANQLIRAVDVNGIVSKYAGQCVVGQCMPGDVPEACGTSAKMVCNKAMNAALCTAPGIGCNRAFAGDGGPADQLQMSQPVTQSADPGGRIAFDKDGNLYFADYGNHRIRKIDAKTKIVTTVVGTGTAGFAGDGGKATDAQLNNPVDIGFGPDGTMYIADMRNHCIRSVKDGIIHTAVGQCGKSGFAGDGGSPTAALLDRPYGLDVAPNGDLYVADTFNSRLRLVMR